MALLQVDFDPTIWVEIPDQFPFGEFQDLNQWSDSISSMLTSLQVEPDEGPDLPLMLTFLAQQVGQSDSQMSFACVPDGEVYVATVRVDLLEIEGEFEDVVEALADRWSALLTAPVEVEEVTVTGLGTGRRIVRFQETDEQNSDVFVSVRFLWRTPWADVVLWFVTYDLPPAFPLASLVENLASGIEVYPEEALISGATSAAKDIT